MTEDFDRYYEILGVRAGVSRQELKAAHRDLAKVWHPDRFGHDPRLQAKAQEKLKEINEAYEQLSTRNRTRRPKASKNRETSTPSSADVFEHVARRRTSTQPRWPLTLLALIIFGAGFYFTTRALVRSNTHEMTETTSASEETLGASDEKLTDAPSSSGAPARANGAEQAIQQKEIQEAVQIEPVKPLETKTVMIDPETGLLARAECPLKSRTTYALGNEPVQYCTSHTPELAAAARAKEGKIKTAARRLASASKWLEGK